MSRLPHSRSRVRSLPLVRAARPRLRISTRWSATAAPGSAKPKSPPWGPVTVPGADRSPGSSPVPAPIRRRLSTAGRRPQDNSARGRGESGRDPRRGSRHPTFVVTSTFCSDRCGIRIGARKASVAGRGLDRAPAQRREDRDRTHERARNDFGERLRRPRRSTQSRGGAHEPGHRRRDTNPGSRRPVIASSM